MVDCDPILSFQSSKLSSVVLLTYVIYLSLCVGLQLFLNKFAMRLVKNLARPVVFALERC